MSRFHAQLSSRTGAVVLLAALASIAGPATAASPKTLPTTPQGITLVEVVRELPISQPEILWVRIGDADGRTVLTHDKDGPRVSNCRRECAEEFPPLLAPRDAKAFGDWSLVRRDDGTRQWAYQSRPLYTWIKEEAPGEVATNVGLTETANSKLAENPVVAGSLMPPEGWQVARFTPAAPVVMPDGVDVRLVPSVQAVALTAANGHTLYTSEGDRGRGAQSVHDSRWTPVPAPALASGVGDFTVVARADGSMQWAYRKQPLYTYSEDKLPGDAYGATLEKWRVAVLTENFRPANVRTVSLEGYGDVLTLNGMTLYGGYSFEKRWGGRNLRDTFTNAYYKGKQLGAAACVDAACLAKWRPLAAPADARPNGFWEPVLRPDGSSQWAYKGYALYTYAGDTAPGQHNGQATYDFAKVEGEGFDFKRVSLLQDISKASGGVGVYWNIAKP